MRKHWFTILIVLLIAFFAAFFTLVAISPRQDLQSRGFIPCTDKLIEELSFCKNNKTCTFRAIINNSYCDLSVVGKGMKLWLSGEQKTPWANYIFEPELEEVGEEVLQFYKENPNIEEDMQRLKKLNKELEQNAKEKQQSPGVELEGII